MAEKILRVLLLEDRPADVELLKRELAKAGFTCSVKQVDTRAGFVSALSEFSPEIILCDYRLPSITGMEAIALAKTALPHVPCILVSGTIGEEEAVESLKSGAWDYVIKQRLSRLGPAIERALRESADQQARAETTQALHAKIVELERFNRLMVGREQRMIELKRQVNGLCHELGRPAPYDLSLVDDADSASTESDAS